MKTGEQLRSVLSSKMRDDNAIQQKLSEEQTGYAMIEYSKSCLQNKLDISTPMSLILSFPTRIRRKNTSKMKSIQEKSDEINSTHFNQLRSLGRYGIIWTKENYYVVIKKFKLCFTTET